MVKSSKSIINRGGNSTSDFKCTCGYEISGTTKSLRLKVKLHKKYCKEPGDINEVYYGRDVLQERARRTYGITN